jgi:catechol 2,3-dioxygenase-like lactoylglutathione lyase family enzyme
VEPFVAIDHVQLAMPAGREDEARAFFCGVLGMSEVPKRTRRAFVHDPFGNRIELV